jgi:hypothetical protein
LWRYTPQQPFLTRAAMVAAPQQRSEQPMHDDIWNDDDSWWHHQDQLIQELEEQERIEACNKALAELKEQEDAE